MTTFWAEHAWTGADGPALHHGVVIEVDGDRISSVTADVPEAPEGATRLYGVTLPGLVNGHSHAFHRALRGQVQTERGSFWTWRERMYAIAARLTPENYEELARGVFAEMVLAGITTVGEFHYVHHRPDGTSYPEPTAMSEALVRAATAAGIRLTLLDTCYLAGGFDDGVDVQGATHVPLAPHQRRFGDGTAAEWARRAGRTHARLSDSAVRVGAAVHSVRAVPAEELSVVASWANDHEAPLHVHVSEQPAENADCLRVYGMTPIELLRRNGVLDHRATAVHATHLSDDDIEALAAGDASVCFCVTTERDLADGIGPAAALVARGIPLTLGSDSHAVIDLFEEARGVELGERVISNRRGHFLSTDLLAAATVQGAASLGWAGLGTLEQGALADFITVSLGSIRLAGASPDSLLESVVFSATASDVATVVVAGRTVVADGRHALIGDPSAELHRAILAVTGPLS